MDEDDEMVVIIVGDGSEDDQQTFATPPATPIKAEPVDELEQSDLNPESILETAEFHGEYIIQNNVKEENYDCEYLEDDVLFDQDVIKPSVNDAEGSNTSQTKRISYIHQLRKNFPKMRKDDNYLIAHLVDVMRSTKAPPPPSGFCVLIEGIHVCTFCNAESISLPQASRHYQKKHGSRAFVCLACGANYKCTTGLYKHEKRCQAADANLMLRARGQYLGRKGRQRPFLTRNKFCTGLSKPKEKTYNYRTRFFCSLCSATFKYKDALESHEYMHKGIRPYQCDQCPMAYTSGVALKRHQHSIHTDVQYTCDTCKRSFKIKNTLITHMNTHLPEPKYPCHLCNRRFAQKYAVRSHINRDHLNIPPPYACAACPQRYPRMSNLKAHMKSRHGLTLMSRKSFYKALPSMKQSELMEATIVFNKHSNMKHDAAESVLKENDVSKSINKNTKEGIIAKLATKDIFVEIVPATYNEGIPGSPLREAEMEIKAEPISEHTTAQGIETENNLLAPTTEKSKNKKTIKAKPPKIDEIETENNLLAPTDKNKNKKTKKNKPPKIDLSFVAKPKNKIYISPPIPHVNFKDMPVLIAEENADLMVATGNGGQKGGRDSC